MFFEGWFVGAKQGDFFGFHGWEFVFGLRIGLDAAIFMDKRAPHPVVSGVELP